jgi:MFS family permease
VALPLVAVALGAGAWDMGVLAACGRLPYLIFGLPAGVWVDRLPRRRVLMVCGAGQAVTLGLVPAAAWADLLSFQLLVTVAFVTGTLAAFADIAALALVPVVVPGSRLISAQGALETSQSGAQIAGPALAGWLVQALSAPVAILVDAVSFLLSTGTVAAIEVHEPTRHKADRPTMRRQIADGARAVFGQRILRYVTLCTTTHIFFFNAFTAVLVLFLSRDLGMTPSVLGATLAAGAVGGLVGSITAARIGRAFRPSRVMAAAIMLAGAGSALVALAGPSVAVVAGAQALMWFALQVYNVLQVPLRYALTPPAIHGTVNATIRTTVWGTAPFGALTGGVLGDTIGLRATVIVSGVGAVCAALWLILTRFTAGKADVAQWPLSQRQQRA